MNLCNCSFEQGLFAALLDLLLHGALSSVKTAKGTELKMPGQAFL